jgi:hypothetical protein
MPDRLLRTSILTSENYDSLSCGGESLFTRLLLICDDYGRFEADIRVLLARCYPLKVGILSIQEVTARVAELVAAGIIELYEVAGKVYGVFCKWEKHNKIRAKSSKFPQPPTSANTCQHMSADASTCEHMSVYTYSESESYAESDIPFNPPLEVVEGEVVDAELVDESEVPIFPVTDEDPWWDGDVDLLVREAVLAYLQVPRFAKTPPSQTRFEKLIADQRVRAPDDEAIRYEFEGWVAYYLNSKKYTDGVATMRSWFGTKHDRWTAMRKRNPQSAQDRLTRMLNG